jgi:2'-5' RNA ligase
VRLFTAIELPATVRQHLVTARAAIASTAGERGAVSWVQPENLHVTLKFLGEVPDERLGRLCDALARVIVEPTRLVAGGLVLFPKRGAIRVIAAGLSGEVERFGRLFADVEDACASAGFEREGRIYMPHVTLGRARPGRNAAGLRRLRDDVAAITAGPEFTADGFVLMQSQLHPKGAIYTPAAHFPRKSST